jgi:hypothetical protein
MDILEKDAIENASLEAKIVYAKEHLLEVGNIVSKLYNKKEFKKILFSKMNSKNSKGLESKILVKDLLKSVNKRNIISNEDKKILDNSLKSFYDLEGQNWEVSLFMPFMEKQKIDHNKMIDSGKPVIIVSVEDVPDPIGYQEDDEIGALVPIGSITETEAESLILNGQDMIIVAIDDDFDGVNSKGSSSGSATNGTDYLKLGEMKVKQHKENWHNGKSEIHVRGFWDPNSSQYGDFFTFHNDNEYGSRMKRFKRRWIRNKNTKTLNFKLLWNWDNVDNMAVTQYFSYTIFEYDSWPAPKKEISLPSVSDGTRTTKFRSWQSEYSKATVVLHGYDANYDYASNHQLNNSGISYNFYRDYN